MSHGKRAARRATLAAATLAAVSAIGNVYGAEASAATPAEAAPHFSLTPGLVPAAADDEDGAQAAPSEEPLYAVVGPGNYVRRRAPVARRPFMQLLDWAGVADTLDEWRIDVYGRAEVGYTTNLRGDPVFDLNLGRLFDVENDEIQINQIDLNVERPVEISGDRFDVGGRVEMLYGTDARFLHSSGFLDNDSFFEGPENQFDIPQLYADVNVPVGSGLRVRAGKFLFFKQIDPNASVFYSHSFTYGGALPFTLTGVTGYYNVTDDVSVELGINRGWDQTFDDNNDKESFHGRVRYTPNDRTNLALLFVTGPELNDDNAHWRTVVDFVASYQVNDRLTLLADAIYGYQAGVPGLGTADWYGVAGYAVYEFEEHFTGGLRLEYYRDDEAFTTGIDQSLWEATVGLTITPFPEDPIGQNIKIRPEVRIDRSSEEFFDGLTSKTQATLAVDVIFNY